MQFVKAKANLFAHKSKFLCKTTTMIDGPCLLSLFQIYLFGPASFHQPLYL